MPRWSICLRRYAVLAGLASYSCWQVGLAVTSITDNADRLLKQAQALELTDHPRFLLELAKLNQQASRLTNDQQWHLRYLNAWEAMYESDYAKSGVQLRNIIHHSNDASLVDHAAALLLTQLGFTRHYEEAFDLANKLAARLPQVTNVASRFRLQLSLSSSMGLAGQTDLAVHYARMAMGEIPAGQNPCYPITILVDALDIGHRLRSDSPELKEAFAVCPADKEPVYNTDLTLTLATQYLHEGQPRKALALLDQIAPSLRTNGYAPDKLTALVRRAQALAALGDDAAARRVALKVVSTKPSNNFGSWLKDTYQVLYRIAKKQGDAAAALNYYEKYAALDKAYLDDINARAMAYETVQQHLLAQKLETEKLGQQNEALRLQQKLDAKTAETNRLYLTLLLVVLGFGVIWMLRLKRSQLRFKRLSHLDGLTTTYNRQHFMDEAARTLRLLEKRQGMACLAIIDLDHFKRVNDSHGHAMGDEVLRRTVDASREHLRPIDLFGRLGGEEFGILLVDCSREQGVAIAERIRAAIEDTEVECDGMVIAISTSIGLAFTDSSGHDLRRLCTDADAALYRAKRGGRNCVMAGESITV